MSMIQKRRNNRRSRKFVRFNPNHDFIDQATTYFLENGGTITKLEFDENSYNIFVSGSESPIAVDEFLSSGGL